MHLLVAIEQLQQAVDWPARPVQRPINESETTQQHSSPLRRPPVRTLAASQVPCVACQINQMAEAVVDVVGVVDHLSHDAREL